MGKNMFRMVSDVLAPGSGALIKKKKHPLHKPAYKEIDKAKEQQLRRKDDTARETARQQTNIGAKRAGQMMKGQGGDGSLLTGSGGRSDPALTGKSTLIGRG